MGAFEAFYGSSLQHPWLLWAAALLAGGHALTRRSLPASTRRYCAGLVLLSLADAWATSQHVYGLGALPDPASRFVPLFFVLAGDFRVLLLFTAADSRGGVAPGAGAIAAAAGLTLLVPVLSQAVLAALPEAAGGARVLFLVYELLFFALALALLRWHPGVARAPWIRAIGRFALLYYGLWAAADAIIMAGAREPGFALRVVPNLLYYGGVIAVIARAAAAAARRA